MAATGTDRLVVVDTDAAAFEAMFAMPVEMHDRPAVLAGAITERVPAGAVVVAPAVRLAKRYAATSGLEVAVVRKVRMSGRIVQAGELIGDLAGRPTVVVDDMITTAPTVDSAVGVLRAHG